MGAVGCVARRETQTLGLLSVEGRVEWHIYANQLSLGAPCTSGSVQLWGVESSRRKGSLDAPGAHQMAEQERRGEEEGEMILLGSLASCFASDVRKIGAAHHWSPAHTSCSDIVINSCRKWPCFAWRNLWFFISLIPQSLSASSFPL